MLGHGWVGENILEGLNMWTLLTGWNKWLASHMFFVVLAAVGAGFALAIPKTPAVSALVAWLFAYMTFVSALDASLRDFFQVLRRPWIAVWVLLLIHVATPLIAWLAGHLAYPHDAYVRMGFLINASNPIAVTSLIWTSLTGGDVTLSLAAITLDTLISPFFLPVFFTAIAGHAVDINYLAMFWQLILMVTLPSLAGMLVHDLTQGKLAAFTASVGGLSSKAAVFLIVFFNAAAIAPQLHWNLWLAKLLAVILLLVASGYLLGFAGSFLLRERRPETVIALIYNVGMRNIAFGAVLALAYFPTPVAVPAALGSLFQQPLAGLVAHWLPRLLPRGQDASQEPRLN